MPLTYDPSAIRYASTQEAYGYTWTLDKIESDSAQVWKNAKGHEAIVPKQSSEIAAHRPDPRKGVFKDNDAECIIKGEYISYLPIPEGTWNNVEPNEYPGSGAGNGSQPVIIYAGVAKGQWAVSISIDRSSLAPSSCLVLAKKEQNDFVTIYDEYFEQRIMTENQIEGMITYWANEHRFGKNMNDAVIIREDS